MSTAAARVGEAELAGSAGAGAAERLSGEVHDHLAAVEPLWRALEADGIATPYQRLDFCRAFAEHLAAADAFEPRLVVLRDAGGRPRLLLPLAVRRRFGVRIASFLGGKHANFHMPLFAGGAIPNAQEITRALREVAAALGIDAYAFSRQPVTWRGHTNPLAAGGTPSASNAYRLGLEPDAELTLERAFSRDARKKLRQKEKKLAALGVVAHRLARDAANVDAALAAFYGQKEVRFRELGIPNPFAEAATQAFLRAAALAGLEHGTPALELHVLQVGERTAAVFGAAVDRDRACGMVISFDGDPELARSSPGDLLLRAVIAFQCRSGRRTFDLGVGEARYKGLCDEVEELVDRVLPVTARGHAFAAGSRIAGGAKRWVKQTPWAWRLASSLRSKAAKAAA